MSSQRAAMHAGEAVAEALREEGVERVFSVPGSHIHPIYDGLSRVKSIRMVTCKQEPNASLMADAYGRLTGKPGVCVLTAGPGGVNSMAGVAQAYGAASPMVHIGGAVPLKADMESFHGVDEPACVHEMVKRITKWSARVERLEDIPGVMAKAFHAARSGRPGPVHVELPRLSDYSEYILQQEPAVLPPYAPIPAVAPRPDPKDVDRFAKRLMAAKAPVLAAGKGVIRKGAMRELSELAMRLQAPVVSAQDAIGVIPENHPFFAGHFSHYRTHPLCAEAMKRADLVLAVGLRAGAAELTELRERAPGNFILIGFDDAPDDRYRGEDQRVADPKLFLDALLEKLGGYERPRDEALIRRMAGRKAALRRGLAEQNAPHKSDNPIYPGIVMDAMNAVLDDRAVVSSDVGNCQMWARTFRRIATPESFMQSGVWNAMSYGLPTAIVAKLEFPERDVVALAGDGAFLMTIGDLPTAAEYGANILIVILNDGAFGQTFMQEANLYGHTYGTTFQSPRFAEIARACGCEGLRVADPKDLEGALRQGLAATKAKPALVEVMVDRQPYPKV
ncbi:MAG: thiamine pyrophosphate-binding protein [Candidatus Tectomicrobia bacterium]|uniref:Thiamine pyrophosphate-binding protein n=1 Tax=Tectimicrobiota bacterium TaxID=2528274 RepID=A0A932ZXL7_UNCTE|nr:thiamine pyrophosphate-binding protein [Candidatus Tectomicrobia bacterium]